MSTRKCFLNRTTGQWQEECPASVLRPSLLCEDDFFPEGSLSRLHEIPLYTDKSLRSKLARELHRDERLKEEAERLKKEEELEHGIRVVNAVQRFIRAVPGEMAQRRAVIDLKRRSDPQKQRDEADRLFKIRTAKLGQIAWHAQQIENFKGFIAKAESEKNQAGAGIQRLDLEISACEALLGAGSD